ncbi:MAG TPA: hypothetical protein VL979_03445 [Solirubrobacteraceae bacterium]|nr:hypothetical protein [Solirubrobacteraceae bacterium]
MSQRLKITLSDAVMAELRSRAERAGEPVARIAAHMVSQLAEHNPDADRAAATAPAVIADDDFDADRHAPWIEPVMGDPAWRRRMWGSIVALHGRYPQALTHLKDGWWKDASHVETLCALVVWRDWIDIAADDPRHELAFQAQLTDYGQALRQEGGSITSAWTPGAAPDEWTY